jgi:phospholipase C
MAGPLAAAENHAAQRSSLNMRARDFAFPVVLIAAQMLTACSGVNSSVPAIPTNGGEPAGQIKHNSGSGKIQHVIIMIQENRSFDNLFATFPGANGTTYGYYLKKVHGVYKRTKITLKQQALAGGLDFNHAWKYFVADYDNGNMDGFNLEGYNGNNPAGTRMYQYVNTSQIQPYWTIAQQYALADEMFQTQGSGSFSAHQDLIAGATAGTWNSITGSLIDYPNNSTNWGCAAPKGTVTNILTPTQQYLQGQGPFPCLTYPTGTLRDVLDAKGVSWKYYTPKYKSNTSGALWNAFAAIDAVYHGPEWKTNVSMPETNIFNDITNSQLPAVSWLIPDQVNSDHPHQNSSDNGPSWVASVVNAIGTSSYWNSTAIVVVWDDWGGFYDHVPPPQLDYEGLGFRVPMLVVSPYVKAATISHTQYEFGSILKFVEQTFGLSSMGTTDVRATSIGDIFNFKMKARTFQQIQAPRNRAYFLHEPPSNEPVDTQ